MKDRVQSLVGGQAVLVGLVRAQFRGGGLGEYPLRNRRGRAAGGRMGVAPSADLIDLYFVEVLDHVVAAAHVAIERGVSHRHLRLVAGREQHQSKLVGERHKCHAADAGLKVLFGDVGRAAGELIGHHREDDGKLCEEGIVRIYDVFAYDSEFEKMEYEIMKFGETIAPFRGSSREFMRLLGNYLIEKYPNNESVVTTCTRKNVPIFIPAICDSSIGIGLMIARRNGVDVDVDQIADTDELTRFVEDSKKTGVVYVGGGVPKNFIQQTQVIGSIYQDNLNGHYYAIQYTTDSPQWGGLSGCTFEEAISWGKESVEAQKVQVFIDATIALPIVLSALIGKGVKRAKCFKMKQ